MEREGGPGRWGSWPYRRDSGRERLIGGEWFGASYVQLVEEFSLVRTHATNTFWASQGMFSRPDLVHVTLDVSVEGWLETTLRRQKERWKDLRASVNIRPTTCLAVCSIELARQDQGQREAPVMEGREWLAAAQRTHLESFSKPEPVFDPGPPLYPTYRPVSTLPWMLSLRCWLLFLLRTWITGTPRPSKDAGLCGWCGWPEYYWDFGGLLYVSPTDFFRRVDEGPEDELAWSTVLVLDYRA
ncbi:hypothetical protein FA13DRAFT_1719688 [Coprinellus micaceus]|uniref:Uncharacterized protein n=1 Tax=Coprinellus micaceus TaxID=71717 RepID=A0A4Y7SCN8_COPMI|nr:hypothetical protein FA13DRAFT_1719688 [Coprinellus micaceus]